MPAPTFIGAVQDSDSDAESIELDVSSLSIEDGDLAIAIVAFGAVSSLGDPPEGWIRITGNVIAEDVELEGELLFRFLLENDSVFEFVGTDSGPIAAGIVVYRGVESLSALDVEGETVQTVSGGSHVAPDVTTTVDDVLLVSANFLWFGNTQADVDGGQNERVDVSILPTGGGTDRGVSILVGDESFTPAGATGTRTASTPNENGLSNNIAIALRPSEDERSAFDKEFGVNQGRIDPTGYIPPDGAFAWTLGHDQAEQFENLSAGDWFEVKQIGDFDTVNIVRVQMNTRGPQSMPAGLRWKASLRIDGVERASAFLDSSRRERQFKLAANVSQIAPGDHELAFRIEVVSI